MNDSVPRAMTLVVGLAIALSIPDVSYAVNCLKKPDHPQCGDPEPPPPEPALCENKVVFPAFAFPEGNEILVADTYASRVETILSLSEGLSLGGYRLRFDSESGEGSLAWSETIDSSGASSIYVESFVVGPQGDIELSGSPIQTIGSQEWISGFDLKSVGDQIVVAFSEYGSQSDELTLYDATCEAGVCNVSPVYPSSSGNCLINDNGACWVNDSWTPVLSNDGNTIYFNVTEPNSGENGVVRVHRLSGGWSLPELLIDSTNYPEVGVSSLSGDGRWLAIEYLAGFLSGGLRDDRIIVLDTQCSDCGTPSSPLLSTTVSQEFSSWNASWTVDDTLYLEGNEGRRRKLVHPVEEFFPFLTGDDCDGLRIRTAISLSSHIPVDSSL